ncbi:DinB family protein [Jejudonia soesokkakensis]|uniref:DinB family protein n=1 Tax=Jejudonia soesokkakensis TaxID=1323432 RepID=A0ABW2MPM0_9FLAO
MNKITQLCIILGMIVISATAQQADVKGAFLEKWENSKIYMLAIAEAMPEEYYDFKPTERQMTFKEQLMHIKSNMDWLSGTYFSTSESERGKNILPTTKAETIAILSEAFNNTKSILEKVPLKDLKETVTFFAGDKSKLQILNLLQDHVTHHRGQLIVYLNLNEIEPPGFVGW